MPAGYLPGDPQPQRVIVSYPIFDGILKTKILFVCLGNICRSPLAKALFEQRVQEMLLTEHFSADSAGTSDLHAGENADSRTILNAQKNGLSIKHSARQFQPGDFDNFDLIVVMDESNYRNVAGLARSKADLQRIHYMREWDPENPGMEVPDPWFGGATGFQEVFEILNRCATALCMDLAKK